MTHSRQNTLAQAETHRAAIEGARGTAPAAHAAEYGGGTRQGWQNQAVQAAAKQLPAVKKP